MSPSRSSAASRGAVDYLIDREPFPLFWVGSGPWTPLGVSAGLRDAGDACGSGDARILLYEIAYQQFSDVIPLREQEPYAGTLEITFWSSTRSALVGSSTGV